MNKHNKLAKNAIRARKSKNKRANDQDNPKKGKRFLTRLGVLLGCLLLVSALVVPCFAQQPADVVAATEAVEPLYADFYRSNISIGGQGLALLMPTLGALHAEKADFFNKYYVLFGTIALGYNLDTGAYDGHPLAWFDSSYVHDAVGDDPLHMVDEVYSDSANGGVDAVIVYGPYYDRVSVRYDNTSVEYQCEFDASYGYPIYRIKLRLKSTNIPDTWDEFTYASLDRNDPLGSLTLDGAKINGIDFTQGDLHNTDFAFSFDDESSFSIMTAIARLFLGDRLENNDSYHILYPNYFFSTAILFNNSDNNVAYENGYTVGYKEGYDVGFNRPDGYQEGYNDAVKQIDSGEFGRNFLAGIFNAPMDAMNEFVIASWQTPNGQTMRITLGLVLGSVIGLLIFVWFLKMFAGG